jgi:hypothetical protein
MGDCGSKGAASLCPFNRQLYKKYAPRKPRKRKPGGERHTCLKKIIGIAHVFHDAPESEVELFSINEQMIIFTKSEYLSVFEVIISRRSTPAFPSNICPSRNPFITFGNIKNLPSVPGVYEGVYFADKLETEL